MLRVKEFNYKKITKSAPESVCIRLSWVSEFCVLYGWSVIKYHPRTYVLNLVRGEEKMNIYLSTGTIQTAIDHPKQNKTQLNRKCCTRGEFENIFKNVRTHTGKGYHKAKK